MTDAAGSPSSRRRRVPWWAGLLVGVAGAAAGLLPWLVSGARLPVQDLWRETFAPEEMPVALLPLSQYTIVLVYGLLVMGSGVAALAVRSLRGGALAAWFAFLGLVAVQVTAVVQSTIVLGGGLRDGTDARLYLIAVVAVAIIALVFGIIVFALVARSPRGLAVVGLAGAAVAVTPWLEQFIVPSGSVPSDAVLAVLPAAEYVTPALIGVAIAWAGVGSIGRVLGALIALAIAWIAPALSTALFNAAGSRVLAHDVPEMIRYGVDVFFAALLMPALALRPLGVVVGVAVVGLIVRALVVRRRRSAAAPVASSDR